MRLLLPLIPSPEGTIAYRGNKGPQGFDVAEMESSLTKLLDAR